MKYNVLITDYDGTMAESLSNVSEKNLQAIKRFINAGGTFTVCTGRMRVGILPILKELGISGTLICFNGAEILDIDTGKLYYSYYIDNETAVKALTVCDELGAYVHTYHDNKLVIERRIDHTAVYETFSRIKATVVGEKLSEYYKRTGKETAKFYVYGEADFIDVLYNRLVKEVGDELLIIKSNPRNLEITAKGVSKGNAVKLYAEKQGFDVSKTVAVGDGGNDAPMLKFAGLGIAVQNAVDDAKNAADVVLDVTCNEDAIAKVIDEYCF